MNTIILKTQRLVLKKITNEYKSDLYKLLADPDVHEFFPNALNHKEAEEFYDKIQYHYKTEGHSFWAVVRKTDDIFIGICGLLSQTIDNIKEIEVGYRLLKEYWNNGYGTEAALGCVEYAKEHLQRSSIISLIVPDNKPSIRVAQKNGLLFEKETMFHGILHKVYRKVLS